MPASVNKLLLVEKLQKIIFDNYLHNSFIKITMSGTVPIRLLSDIQYQNPSSTRTTQQIQILNQLLANNKIFQLLNIQQKQISEICRKMQLIWNEQPQMISTSENSIYFVLDGAVFESTLNKFISLKIKTHENSDFVMLRKLFVNEYFTDYVPLRRFRSSFGAKKFKKYLFMAQEKTLLGKISGEFFQKLFEPALFARWKKIYTFCQNISTLSSLSLQALYQISVYFIQVSLKKNNHIIFRDKKSPFMYFIQKGEAELKFYLKSQCESQKQQNSLSNSRSQSLKPIFKKILTVHSTFGMEDSPLVSNIELQTECQATSITDCKLYLIDKRIFAIVISSFNKSYTHTPARINLNRQISMCDKQFPNTFTVNQHQNVQENQKKNDLKTHQRLIATSQDRRSVIKQSCNQNEKRRIERREIRTQSCRIIPRPKYLIPSQNFSQKKNEGVGQKQLLFENPETRKCNEGVENQIKQLFSLLNTSKKQLKTRKKIVENSSAKEKNLMKNDFGNETKKQMLKNTKLLIEKGMCPRNKERTSSKLDFQERQPRSYTHKRNFSEQRKQSVISLQQNLIKEKIIDDHIFGCSENVKIGGHQQKFINIKSRMASIQQQNLFLISSLSK